MFFNRLPSVSLPFIGTAALFCFRGALCLVSLSNLFSSLPGVFNSLFFDAARRDGEPQSDLSCHVKF